MPSYRSFLTIGLLEPGVAPGVVHLTVCDAVRECTAVESWDVSVRRGVPVLTVRFTGDDDAHARSIHDVARSSLRGIAQVTASGLSCVEHGKNRFLS
ncbi:hypothetical protein [Actinomyces vulturis]|uniref:hypothetical protein n=1 Tax=Actinomyces vulturis TaxID=1857645 RepID=UPI00082C5E9C|nr:hypothetical protein [Actinomyces vulturis]